MGKALGRGAVVLLLIAGFIAAANLASAATNATTKTFGSVVPPNGTYTCAWIAAHPAEALAAQVTCDSSLFSLATAPNAIVTLTQGLSPQRSGGVGVHPDSNGCTYIPNTGNIGSGVYGWSGYEYANSWTFTPSNSPATYTYYIQLTGPSPYTSGNEYDIYTHNVGVPANIYRWGVQNHSVPNNWYLCYSG
jgi:hypothetical protein